MKRKLIPLLIIYVFSGGGAIAQPIITLKDCYESALANHSLSTEKQRHQQLWQLKDKNLVTSWYPSLDAGVNILYILINCI